MMFAAAYPKEHEYRKTFTELGDGKIRVKIEGEMNGPEGISRSVSSEVVYSDKECVFARHFTNQRLNWNSGWCTDWWYAGDKTLSSVSIDDYETKYDDPETYVLGELNGELRGPIWAAKSPVLDKVQAKAIECAKNKTLPSFTNEQLMGQDPL
jgi:hypothetical protein